VELFALITLWIKCYVHIKIFSVKKTTFNLLATLDNNKLLLQILISTFRSLQMPCTYSEFLIKVKKEMGKRLKKQTATLGQSRPDAELESYAKHSDFSVQKRTAKF